MNFASRTATLLALASLFAPAALAQRSDLKRALPNSTLMFVSMPDLDTSLEEFQSTPLAKIWREKEVQDFFADAMKMVHKKIGEGMASFKEAVSQGQSPLTAEEILGLRIHGATFALTGLKIEAAENGRPNPDVGILLHLNFGSSAASWKKAIDFGIQMAEGQAQGMLVRSEAKVGEVQMVELAPQVEEIKNSLSWAWMGDSLLLGTRSAEFKAALVALTSGKDALTASANYKAVAKHVDSKGAEVEMFLNWGSMLDSGMEILDLAAKQARGRMAQELDIAGVKRAIEALGLRSMTAMGYASRYENGKSISEGYTVSPEPTRRGIMSAGKDSLSTTFLKWVPKDATGFDARKLDFASAYEGIMGAVRAYDPERAKEVQDHLAKLEEHIGFKIQEDLFGALGDEFIWWSMPIASIAQAPDLAALFKMRDEKKFMKVVKSLVGMSDGTVEIDDVERGGHKMHILKINAEGGGSNPLASLIVPTFAFKNGYMVFGLSANNVKKNLERMDREDDAKGDIRSNPELAKLLEQMPKEGLSSLAYTDWKSNLEGYYQLLTTALAFLPVNNSEIPIDLSLLPEASTLTKHMFGSLSWTTTDANGFRAYSQGPFGPEIYVGLVGIGAAAGIVTGVQRSEIAGPRGGRRVEKKQAPAEDQDEPAPPKAKKKDK